MAAFQFISFRPVTDVTGWGHVRERPTGSREKGTVLHPDTGRHYIFKCPKPGREHQIWSELLASYIAGDLLGWDVQHTSVAQRDGRPGNLLEYFFEVARNENPGEIFIEGWVLCQHVDENYDADKGNRHTLDLLLDVCEKTVIEDYQISREEFYDHWARAFALDCLISNTDRHAENWGIIVGADGARMAPLYDHGTSMGCGLDGIGLGRAFDGHGRLVPGHIDRQRRNGRHHVRVDGPGRKGAPFEKVGAAFLARHPDGRQRFEQARAVDLDAVRDVMAAIQDETDIGEGYRLCGRRQQHIGAMLKMGVRRITNLLRGGDGND